MKPYYDSEDIPMYLVCSKYCPTNRDVFLNRIKGIRGEVTFALSMGLTIHEIVSHAILEFLEGKKRSFEDFWKENSHHVRYKGMDAKGLEFIRESAASAWNYTQINCNAAYCNMHAEQPFAKERDLVSTAIPFLVEHRLSGKLLGLSGILGIDCYDYLRGIVYDLKVVKIGGKLEDWSRLYPTGYALVLESIYEIPIDIGCVLSVNFVNGRMNVKKEYFFISDELRSWWIEERDKKLEIVSQKKDPGICQKCPEDCIYWNECRGS